MGFSFCSRGLIEISADRWNIVCGNSAGSWLDSCSIHSFRDIARSPVKLSSLRTGNVFVETSRYLHSCAIPSFNLSASLSWVIVSKVRRSLKFVLLTIRTVAGFWLRR